jgi:hypothetical protein
MRQLKAMNAHSVKTHQQRVSWLLRRASSVAMLLAACVAANARNLAPDGCPVFHCTVEATGTTYQPMISSVTNTSVTNNSSNLGYLPKQGCSGNGTILACLFATDNATGIAKGTLKQLNANTLQADWGSAGAASSFNLNAATSASGQVPVVFSNGYIAAGDGTHLVLYDSTGAALKTLALTGNTLNLGLTPLSATYGVVSEANGMLTLVNMNTWKSAGTLTLVDPVTNGALVLVSPSSAAPNVLYAVAENKVTGNGYLFSIALNATTNKLVVSSVFTYTGETGASPVIVTPSISGLSNNMILLHVPGLVGDTQPQNRLLGLLDSPTGIQQMWAIPLTAPLVVAPTFDQNSLMVFYHQNYSAYIYQNQLLTGTAVRTLNLQSIAGMPASFELNTHLGATQYGSTFTLLLGGQYSTSPGVGAQFVLAYQPIASPKTLLWSQQISTVPLSYYAAWNFAPSLETGIVCPIAITSNTTSTSLMVRLCDH